MSATWVVFTGKADLRLLRMLRPGFRHCFAVMRQDAGWILIDPMLHRLDVSLTHCDAGFDLPGYLRGRGYCVLRAPDLAPPRRVALPSPFTCVETMKRLIGLHDWRVVTPWQLYRRLTSITHDQGENNGKPVFQA